MEPSWTFRRSRPPRYENPRNRKSTAVDLAARKRWALWVSGFVVPWGPRPPGRLQWLQARTPPPPARSCSQPVFMSSCSQPVFMLELTTCIQVCAHNLFSSVCAQPVFMFVITTCIHACAHNLYSCYCSQSVSTSVLATCVHMCADNLYSCVYPQPISITYV